MIYLKKDKKKEMEEKLKQLKEWIEKKKDKERRKN